MNGFILAHDLGTTSHKCVAFDMQGNIAASVSVPYPTKLGSRGEVVQNPSDWWDAVVSTTKQVLAAMSPSNILAVSFSGHMMGACPIGQDGTPLHPSLIHADTRSAELAPRIFAAMDKATLYRLTGNRIDSHYPLMKLLWLKEYAPDVYRHTAYFLQAKDYLAFRMSGCLGVTDFSDASLTGMYNVNTSSWEENILRELGLDLEKLPEIHPSATVIGSVTADAARWTGLLQGTPVVLGGGDGACATIGAGAIQPGDAYINMGTTAWVARTVKEPLLEPEQRVFTMCGPVSDFYTSLGTMQTAGAAYEWAVREVGGGLSYEQAEQEVARIPWGSDGLIFLPYLLGERSPLWNERARGLLFGLDARHRNVHVLKAVMEGIGYHLRSIADILDPDRATAAYRLIGGGARSGVMRSILSTVLDKPILAGERTVEASSLGAAMMAGVAIGLFANYKEASQHMVTAGSRQDPDAKGVATLGKGYTLFGRLYDKLKEEYELLDDLRSDGSLP